VHALALRLCGNAADADDAVQEAFLTAYRRWHTFKGEADAGTWLYAIAAHGCGKRRRGARKVPAVSQLMPWKERTVMAVAAAPAEDESPAERREAVARVQHEIAALPEHLRVPLVLKEVLGAPVGDVASTLGLTAATVKTRLHRARLLLRKQMTAGAGSVPAPAPIFDKQVCLDLLKAKLDAMDRGGVSAGFRVPQAEACARCRAVFRELDLVQDACTHLASGELPAAVRAAVERALAQRDAAANERPAPARRGRRPLAHGQTRPAR